MTKRLIGLAAAGVGVVSVLAGSAPPPAPSTTGVDPYRYVVSVGCADPDGRTIVYVWHPDVLPDVEGTRVFKVLAGPVMEGCLSEIARTRSGLYDRLANLGPKAGKDVIAATMQEVSNLWSQHGVYDAVREVAETGATGPKVQQLLQRCEKMRHERAQADGRPPALAQERVIGLLALPEVFGRGACDRFTPRPVALRATPQGRAVGTVLVVKPWTHHADGGCEGLEVGVQAPPAATAQPLPTMEYAYEEPGVVVLEQRGKWFRVRLNVGSAWLEASAQDEFYGLEKLFEESPTYLTDAWRGQLAASPGSAGRPAKFPRLAANQPVRVRRASREKEGLWFFVDIMSHSACDGDGEPTVVDQGWVPAYGEADAPTIWFSSRGC